METLLSICGHTCTDLGILIAREVEEKEELKNLLHKFSLSVMVDWKIVTYLKNKNQDFRCLNEIIHHVTVSGVVWCNPLIFLTH